MITTPTTWQRGVQPTPKQFMEWIGRCSPDEREAVLTSVLTHSEAGIQCFAKDHENALSALVQTALRQQSRITELETLLGTPGA